MTLLQSWPTVTDDSGTKTDGTVFNKALTDAIKASVEDNVHSTTNPTLKAKSIIDEVVTARGSKSTLDTRLDVSINDDGTLKTQAGVASTTELRSQVVGRNVAKNPELREWSNGAAAAPDYFTLSGAGATVARCGPGEADTFSFGAGKYSVRVTCAFAVSDLTEEVISTADFADNDNCQGQNFSVAVKCKAGDPVNAFVRVDDGVTQTDSSYHTGGGSEETLTVVHKLSASATHLYVMLMQEVAGDVYWGGFTYVFSDVAPNDWSPLSACRVEHSYLHPTFTPGDSEGTNVPVSGRIYSSYTDVGNVGTGEDDLHSYSLPADVLSADGKAIRITAWGETAANGNTKAIKVYFGSTVVASFSGTPNNVDWQAVAVIMRTGAATQRATGTLLLPAISYECFTTTPGETLSGAITVKLTGEATSNNDIVQKGFMIEVIG